MIETSEPGVPFPLSASLSDLRAVLDGIAKTFRSGSGPGIWPFPGLPAPGPDGGARSGPPPGYSEAPGRADYAAYRLGSSLFIKASGTLPNWNQIADLKVSSWKIFPQQFEMVVYSPQIVLPATRSFLFIEQFGFPLDADVCVVNDADGAHIVKIAEGAASADGEARSFLSVTPPHEAVGHGQSLQDAFDAGVAQLPHHTDVADALMLYTVVETGRVEGGLPGFHHHYCKVRFSSQP